MSLGSSTAVGPQRAGKADTQRVPVWRNLTILGLGLIAVKLAFLLSLGINSQYLMDEYAAGSDALLVDYAPYREVWPHKTLFSNYFYRIAHWLGEDSVRVMAIARAQSLVLALAGLSLLYGIAATLYRRRFDALLVVLVALSFSSFIERAFMVRPEPLALVIALAALLVVVRAPRAHTACLIAGLLSGAAFLTMQKAVYFNLALGLALVGDGLLRRSLAGALAAGGLLVLGWVIMVGGYVGAFAAQGAAAQEVILQIFFGPSAQNAARGHEVYDNLRLFLWQSLSRNTLQYVLCGAGLGLGLLSLRRRGPAECVALIFSAVIAALIYGYHPAPWPYNFILAIPFLALWSPLVLDLLCRDRVRRQTLYTAALLGLLSLSLIRNIHYLKHDNATQEQTVAIAEALLSPGDRYFDGVHMLVARPHATGTWLDNSAVVNLRAAAARGESMILTEVFAQQPKVVIESYRTIAIEDLLQPYLENAYLPVAPNVLLAGTGPLTGNAEHRFAIPWPGSYRLYDPEGRTSDAEFVIDGRRARGPVRLNPGTHRLRLGGREGPLYLLPADIDVRLRVLPEPLRKPLFPRAHSF